jgi:hypothetical protein
MIGPQIGPRISLALTFIGLTRTRSWSCKPLCAVWGCCGAVVCPWVWGGDGAVSQAGSDGGFEARFCPGGERGSGDGQTEEVSRRADPAGDPVGA